MSVSQIITAHCGGLAPVQYVSTSHECINIFKLTKPAYPFVLPNATATKSSAEGASALGNI